MKLRVLTQLRKYVAPALMALSLGYGIAACSSSSDAEQPEAGLTAENGAATNNADPNAALNEANNETLASNENTGEGNAEAANNPAGNELQNLVTEGGTDTAGAPPADNASAANAGQDPFANQTAANPSTAPANQTAQTPPENALGGINVANETANANAEANNANVEENNAVENESEETAVAGGVPENGAKMAYYVEAGDTLAKIAQKIYGNKAKWKEIANDNNIVDANKIYAGDVIYYSLNDSSRSFAEKYEGAPRKTITVQAGDTLSKIAAKVYGSEGEWRTLWKDNPGLHNPDVIKVGVVLSYRDFNGALEEASDEEGAEEAMIDNDDDQAEDLLTADVE